MKLCPKCKETKSLDRFYYWPKAERHNYVCKACVNKQAMERYRKSAEMKQRSAKKYRWKKHGIDCSIEQFDELFKKQNGKCKICEVELFIYVSYSGQDRTNQAALDHDHSTGKVRGILCNNCNRCLGLMKDNPDVFRKAAEYLEGATK